MMMIRRQYVLLAAALVATISFAHAQKGTSVSRSPTVTHDSRGGISRSLDSVLEEADQRLKTLDDRAARTDSSLSEIEKRLGEQKKLSLIDLAPALISALAGIIGVLAGGFATHKQQRERLQKESDLAQVKATNDLRLAELQSRAGISSAVVDWQLKQLFLLYGPLRALLGQSFGLYRQMNSALCNAAPNRFRLISSPNPNGQASEDKQEFQVLLSGDEWTRFRVVMHMQHVYGQGLEVEIYLDEIVAIGSRIVNIIQENAGYARPEEVDLMGVFARYLAHFAVMDHQHSIAKELAAAIGTPTTVADMNSHPKALLKVDISAVFPLELPSLINAGFSAITRDIEEWKRKTVS